MVYLSCLLFSNLSNFLMIHILWVKWQVAGFAAYLAVFSNPEPADCQNHIL